MDAPRLEQYAQPITETFPKPGKNPVEHFGLSGDQVQEFDERGFLAGLELLGADEVEQLKGRLQWICDHLRELKDSLYEVESAWLERPDEVVLHFLGAWRVDELFHDLVFHPGATVPMAQALGVGKLRFWHDQVFFKPPRHAGVVPWHQDYSYWTRTEPACHGTVFIALDDMDVENGCLEYVPGSHHWGLFPAQEFGGDLDALSRSLSAREQAEFQPEPISLRAGQASLHHSHLIHGSRGNDTDLPRRAIVLNYMADGTLSASPDPLLKGVRIVAPGQPVVGAHFPLVLDQL